MKKTLCMDLTPEQWEAFKDLCHSYEIPCGELVAEMIRCITGEGNGSDERDLASSWFSREAWNYGDIR